MNSAADTLDHNTLGQLVAANAIRGANIVGEAGGWGVVIRHGRLRQRLAATRSKEARVFKRFETLVSYLRDMGISRFDVDASEFDTEAVSRSTRPDTSAKLKQAHAALAHDKWVRAQAAQALNEARDSTTAWASNDEVMAESAKRRAAWRAVNQPTKKSRSRA